MFEVGMIILYNNKKDGIEILIKKDIDYYYWYIFKTDKIIKIEQDLSELCIKGGYSVLL